MAEVRQLIAVAVFGICVAAMQGASLCDVTSYGAKNDGSARSTVAIHDAIQACAKAGGGTVYFPAGTYETGAIELASNIVLNIDAGATVRFHTDLTEYPLVPGRSEGTEGLTPAPLIGGRNLQNVTITGRGTLTTDNAAWVRTMNHPDARAMWTSIQNRLENKEKVSEEDYRKAALSLRPSFIRPMDSKNILIEGIHIVGSSMWVIHLLYCENVVVRNVTVETYPSANGDGIDIDSSRDVRVSDSYFDTGDDAIVLKSGKGVDGRRVGRPTENVTITNSTFHRAHGAVVIGSETAGGVRNVVASNIVSTGTEIGIRIKSGRSRGGVVENINIHDIEMWDITNSCISVDMYYMIRHTPPATRRSGKMTVVDPDAPQPEAPVAKPLVVTQEAAMPLDAGTPQFRNITIRNIVCHGANIAMQLRGLPELPLKDVTVENAEIFSRQGGAIVDADRITLKNVHIQSQSVPGIQIQDATNLTMENVDAVPLAAK